MLASPCERDMWHQATIGSSYGGRT